LTPVVFTFQTAAGRRRCLRIWLLMLMTARHVRRAPLPQYNHATYRARHAVVLHELGNMVALWNRADHYSFIVSFVLSSSSSFFLA